MTLSYVLVIASVIVIAVSMVVMFSKTGRQTAQQGVVTRGTPSWVPSWYTGLSDEYQKKVTSWVAAVLGTTFLVTAFNTLYPETSTIYYSLGGPGYSLVPFVMAASVVVSMDEKYTFRRWLLRAFTVVGVIAILGPLTTAIDQQQTAAVQTRAVSAQTAQQTTQQQIGVPVCNTQWECYVDVTETGTNPIPINQTRYYCFPDQGPFQHLAERMGERPEWRDIETNIGQAVTIRFRLKPGMSGTQRFHYDMSAVPCRERGRRT